MRHVSIILPCRDEEAYIERCLQSIIDSDYPKPCMELLVVDGMSRDRSREMIAQKAAAYDFIKLLDNPRTITPCALNIGIRHATGDIIMRMDVHAEYPPNYVGALVEHLETSGADNVGGVCRTMPADDSAMAVAIAYCLAHPFGVGNSYFRVGRSGPAWVDTVPFGCWPRSVFDRIGCFDEDLPRNQDDEFNHRLIRSGGRILLVPSIVSKYYPRESMGKLWRMYFQYGYFKPLAARKLGRVMTLRQLCPAAFILLLFLTAAAGFWLPWMHGIGAGLVVLYGSASMLFAAPLSGRSGPAAMFMACMAFPVIHLAYGFGYLKGILDFLVLKRDIRKEDVQATSLSR